MENSRHVLDNDDGLDIAFTGELVAEVKSSCNNAAGSSYSGQTGVWQELSLYKTESGKYVGYRVTRTLWQGSRDSHEVKIFDSYSHAPELVHDDIKAFFGHGWLAKDLYYAAEIADVFEVA